MNQRLILLDTGPLGLVTNIKANPQAQACQAWFQTVKLRVLLPEISDYELRRELLRAGKLRGLRQLDQLKTLVPYCPITTELMLKLWPALRRQLPRPSFRDVVALAAQRRWVQP